MRGSYCFWFSSTFTKMAKAAFRDLILPGKFFPKETNYIDTGQEKSRPEPFCMLKNKTIL
jgi:hypothetical protein